MPRKTRAGGGSQSGPPPASMRPRPDAAENLAGRVGEDAVDLCFNEAAARCRGKRGEEVCEVDVLGMLQ